MPIKWLLATKIVGATAIGGGITAGGILAYNYIAENSRHGIDNDEWKQDIYQPISILDQRFEKEPKIFDKYLKDFVKNFSFGDSKSFKFKTKDELQEHLWKLIIFEEATYKQFNQSIAPTEDELNPPSKDPNRFSIKKPPVHIDQEEQMKINTSFVGTAYVNTLLYQLVYSNIEANKTNTWVYQYMLETYLNSPEWEYIQSVKDYVPKEVSMSSLKKDLKTNNSKKNITGNVIKLVREITKVDINDVNQKPSGVNPSQFDVSPLSFNIKHLKYEPLEFNLKPTNIESPEFKNWINNQIDNSFKSIANKLWDLKNFDEFKSPSNPNFKIKTLKHGLNGFGKIKLKEKDPKNPDAPTEIFKIQPPKQSDLKHLKISKDKNNNNISVVLTGYENNKNSPWKNLLQGELTLNFIHNESKPEWRPSSNLKITYPKV
ncbi:hypothetical protein ELUMI_v1c04930 [Williamsoniiplasma luminosum]|uniref:Uncharacterized protein n=1 Tax=Williamsoniiplasma luminosum TaxID=214888 RepID=A0A2K8NTX5_9MOLU|nr:hypothetical protein [Williamsoniiplasma luminosum]ATZ17217.1 hypothetical protein ELUMI_v1c04930 [Williamsoniiplasma luminosum]